MLVRQLRYFAAVADEGGVTRAAQRLSVAQPALSRSMRELERTVGATLLMRDSRGVRLTPAGVILRDGADTILAHMAGALRLVALANEGRLAKLRLGLSRASLQSQRLGRIIATFREQYPDVDLVVSEVPIGFQADALKTGELDGTISVGAADDPLLESEVLFEDRVNRALLALSHPLAGASAITPDELRGVPLRLDPRSMAQSPRVVAALKELGFTWEDVDGIDTALSYVAAGNGWLPALGSVRPAPGLTVKPVTGLDVVVPFVVRCLRNGSGATLRNLSIIAADSAPNEGEDTISRGRISTPRLRLAPVVRPGEIGLRQLRALVTAIDTGSLSAAAEQLHVTQSAVSRQVRSLETAIGVRLINRGGRRLVPTAAGEALHGAAITILELIETTLERAREASRGITAHCTIGTVARELTNGVLVSALQQLTQLHPELSVRIEENPARDALLSGAIDVGLTSLFPGAVDHPAISSVLLRDDPLDCALIAESHPLASREWLQPEELMNYPFLFVSRSFSPNAYDLIIRELKALGLAPKLGAQFNGARVLWSVVAGGDAWALGAHSLRSAPPPGIVARPIEGLSIPWGVGLTWRRDEANPAIKQVIETFRNPQRLVV